jgi:hypothetical protein
MAALRLVGAMEQNGSWRWADTRRENVMKKKSRLAAGNLDQKNKGDIEKGF